MDPFRAWMDVHKDRNGVVTREFVDGMKLFLAWAFSDKGSSSAGKIRCLCIRCGNRKSFDRHEVSKNLMLWGFTSNYRMWEFHGELEESWGHEYEETSIAGDDDGSGDEGDENHYAEIVHDLFPEFNYTSARHDGTEEPNPRAKKFYGLFAKMQQELWEGSGTSILEYCTSLMASKTFLRMTEAQINVSLNATRMALHHEKKDGVPKNFQVMKTIMMKMGPSVITIDFCINHCLYYKENEHLEHCPSFHHPPYRESHGERAKPVPWKKLWYFPITKRLQRLYMSRKTAEHMIWHSTRKRRAEIVTHPAESIACAHLDETFPDFASEIRNVRLALSTDGFDPRHGTSKKSYSCWPVFVTPYNLPPELAMRPEFIFMCLLIPGKKDPCVSIDVMIRPVIDECKDLWINGALTYDSFKKQNFKMKAAILCTVSDFPAYGMLSGWSTHGKMACPYCMQNIDSVFLRKHHKPCWFDCHRRFLPINHQERNN